MSKITLFKDIKRELIEFDFDVNDQVTEYIKNYVNGLDPIIPTKDAVDYVINNCSFLKKTSESIEKKNRESEESDERKRKQDVKNSFKDMFDKAGITEKDGLPKCDQQ